LLLGQHRALIDDDRLEIAAARSSPVGKIGTGLAVVTAVADQELRQRLPGTAQPRLLLEPHPRLSGRSEQQDAAGLHLGNAAQHPQQRRFAGPGGAYQHGNPGAEQLFKRGCLF
jgi:hypothetical protein